MEAGEETEAVVALLRSGRRPWASYSNALARGESATALLEDELGLLAADARERASAEVAGWRRRSVYPLSPVDRSYPPLLRALADRPPVVFARGRLALLREASVAVVGTRQATERGRRLTTAVVGRLLEAGLTVVSGLARGIDTAAHEAALRGGGGTIAVVGTGLDHCYPPENRHLQRRIAAQGAILSQFWPEAPPRRQSFPMRNAVMAGVTVATVIIEASPTSGTRIQARMSLACGRKVLLAEALLQQPWARELAARPGVVTFGAADEVDALVHEAIAQRLAVGGAA